MPTTFCKRRQRQKGVGDSSAVEDIRHPHQCGGHQAPTQLWRTSGTHTVVEDIRHPLSMVSVHLYSLPYSTFKSLHTDSLLGENESEQACTILSTGSEQPKIKYLYLIWSLRIESQLLSVCAANGQKNRISNLCAGFSSFTAWMDTTPQWGTAADIHPSG